MNIGLLGYDRHRDKGAAEYRNEREVTHRSPRPGDRGVDKAASEGLAPAFRLSP
jgi:hypothetical protein